MSKQFWGVVVMFFLINANVFGQHLPVYSSYLFNGLVLNPALTGNANALSVSMNYRNQWSGLEGSPQTLTLCVHTPFINKNISGGLIVTNDQLGVSNNTEFINSYSFRFKVKNIQIALGAQLGVAILNSDLNKIELIDANDPTYKISTVQNIPKLGFGFQVSSKKFYAGGSMPSVRMFRQSEVPVGLLTSNQSFFYVGMRNKISDNCSINPSVYAKYLSQSTPQLDINLLATFYQKMNIGVSYRTSDALVFLALYHLNRQFSLGYSYDHIISSLTTSLRGNHEILLRFDFKYVVKDINPKSFN